MKKIVYSMFVCLGCFLSSCEDTSQDPSKVTYFVDLEMKGDAIMIVAQGTTYVDPGYEAISNGEDVTADVKTIGSVNTSAPGIYPLTYSIANEDGFAQTASRTVYVYDITPSPIVSGYHTVSKDSYRVHGGTGAKVVYNSNYPIIIAQLSPGVFYCTDLLGGYYDQRAGYGSNYAMTGKFRLNGDNTITLIESHINGWGDSLTEMTGNYSSETNLITWAATYTATPFIFNCIVLNP